MYTANMLVQKLLNNEFTIDRNGHWLYHWTDEVIFREIADCIIWHMNYTAKKLAEGDDSSGYHAHRKELYASEKYCVLDEYMELGTLNVVCEHCGFKLYFYLQSPSIIGMATLKRNYIHPQERCEFSDGVRPHAVSIEVPTGSLLFANHFGDLVEDCPKDEKYTRPYNLNFDLGRINIAKHLAKQNVGYSQTSNMSVYIYQHKTRDEIIILGQEAEWILEEECEWSEDELAFARTVVAEFNFLGRISCGVWRWMCVDKSNPALTDHERDEYMDYVETTVKQGTWEIVDYFISTESHPMMAKLQLKIN